MCGRKILLIFVRKICLIKIMKTRLIKTEAEHEAALLRLDEMFDVQPGSKHFDEAELLITLIELYEQEHYKIEAPDPIKAIKFRMEQMNLKQVDMKRFFGGSGRVSEILNRQRTLTLAMIKKLHNEFGIPVESLLA